MLLKLKVYVLYIWFHKMNCMIDPVLLFTTVFISFAQQDAGIFSLHLVTALPVIAHLLHFSLLINDMFIYFFDVMSFYFM